MMVVKTLLLGHFLEEEATSGSFNTALGVNYSGRTLTTGDENTFLGLGAGYYITTGDKNICIGHDGRPTSSGAALNNKLYIRC